MTFLCPVYRLILRLHPAAFREEFGPEMVRDYGEAARLYGTGPLFADAVLSLLRQWMVWSLPVSIERRTVAAPSLAEGRHGFIDVGRLTAFDLFRGAILSVLAFGLFGLSIHPAMDDQISAFLHQRPTLVRAAKSGHRRSLSLHHQLSPRPHSEGASHADH